MPLFLLCKPPLVLPEYTEWASGHPVDRDCVTMLLGDGVVHQGEWLDVECVEDTGMFSVCERDKMSVASLYLPKYKVPTKNTIKAGQFHTLLEL